MNFSCFTWSSLCSGKMNPNLIQLQYTALLWFVGGSPPLGLSSFLINYKHKKGFFVWGIVWKEIFSSVHCAPVGQKNLQLLQRQLWTKGICSSHPQPLLGKVKTVGQGWDFHGSSAAIASTPSCGFVMRHILLTKGLLQAHSVQYVQQATVCKPRVSGHYTRAPSVFFGSRNKLNSQIS